MARRNPPPTPESEEPDDKPEDFLNVGMNTYDDYQNRDLRDEQPWWNDGDKVAGLVSTILLLAVVSVIVSGLLWVVVKLWTEVGEML